MFLCCYSKKTKMLLKNCFGIAVLFNALFVTHATQQEKDGAYLFTSPRTLKIGSSNQLQLFRFGCQDQAILKVKLFYKKNYDSNETLLQEMDYQLEKNKKDTFLSFFVNSFDDDYAYDGRLQINGTLCGKPFSGSDRVQFSNSKESIIIIQTDKPLYKPGQDVTFRVLKLDQNLKPSNRANDVSIAKSSKNIYV
ncbi:MG2 domain-containing protein [Trichonephila clavata]|uniref:MG2 domain-containing protein n=1 Tax=Trichonephila clavata TaxID=2740835 RepID=A0A8X6M283_TRICU|nr:MG2 domain-containing protein [Trichonephila clavata]